MNTPSYRKINYQIRPAKSIQRKMLCDAFLRLSFFGPLANYRYVGFGSTTFVDFILFHKILGINDMISIEKQEEEKDRFDFNNPFDCICIKYGDSNNVLPSLDWDRKTIIWLDYDDHLTESILQDIACASTKLVSGSVLVVTVDVRATPSPKPKFTDKELLDYRFEEFEKRVGSTKVPADVKAKDLEGEEMAKTCGRVILNEIKQTLSHRNGLLSPGQKVEYHPLFNFRYQDGAKMLTVGGIFYESGDQARLKQCDFEKLEFVKSDATFYKIDVPTLTHLERLHLDKTLPHGDIEDIGKQIGLTPKDIDNYKLLYRYFTTFAEIELS